MDQNEFVDNDILVCSVFINIFSLPLQPKASLSHCFDQGGKFDHADRLFQGIKGTYRNCLSNTSDVKELIPEFFYMPEFLVNSNSYHLGIKQDGEPLDDVCLPPWAKVCELTLHTPATHTQLQAT